MRYTNWNVITGAPSSGKTSVIYELEKLGYRVVHEVARAYIDEELQKGKSLKEIKADQLVFERHILHKKIEIEKALPDDEVIFLDRAIPDSIAYFKLEQLNSDEPREKSRAIRYHKIFLFDRLGLESDPVRSEDDRIASQLERLLECIYHTLGYKVIRVPIFSVKLRTDFILRHI